MSRLWRYSRTDQPRRARGHNPKSAAFVIGASTPEAILAKSRVPWPCAESTATTRPNDIHNVLGEFTFRWIGRPYARTGLAVPQPSIVDRCRLNVHQTYVLTGPEEPIADNSHLLRRFGKGISKLLISAATLRQKKDGAYFHGCYVLISYLNRTIGPFIARSKPGRFGWFPGNSQFLGFGPARRPHGRSRSSRWTDRSACQ